MFGFEEINDPYLTQRVYAVALGVIVKQTEVKSIKPISDYVYTHFFGKKEIEPDILRRDYARLIIDYAQKHVANLSYDLTITNPPYQSNLPLDLPSNLEIDNLKIKLEIKEYGSSNTFIDDLIRLSQIKKELYPSILTNKFL